MLRDAHTVSFDDLYRQINACDSKPGITQIDILAFTPPFDIVFGIISRKHSLTAAEFAIEFDLTEVQAKQVIDMLVKKGYLTTDDSDDTAYQTAFKINYARKKPCKATTNIWKTLDL